jgi:hypothetical protein
MNRTKQHRHDDAFESVTGRDGKPVLVLKDTGRLRVSMQARDAAMAGTGSHGPRGQQPGDSCTLDGRSGRLRMVNGSLQCVPVKSQDAFTDGCRPLDVAGMRPGYRMPTVEDRSHVHDAYARYNTGVANAYKIRDGEMQCPQCFGSGQGVDGDDCTSCNGTGTMPDPASRANAGTSRFGSNNPDDDPDPASDRRTIDQHRQTMDRLYAARDAELSNAWRGR